MPCMQGCVLTKIYSVMIQLHPDTEAFLLKVAPQHIARPDSPTTFEAVKAQAETGTYVVFDGGSNDTIFTDRKYQYAYRAWHDSIHLTHGLDFSKDSELAVAKLQEQIALSQGVRVDDAKTLRLDLEAHIHYYYTHGEHPVKQIDLIADCLLSSVREVMASGKKYH